MPNITELRLNDKHKDPEPKPYNRVLEGLNVDGWDNDLFFKRYAEDKELTDFETGKKKKLNVPNRAEDEDARAKEIAKLVAEKRINCLFARFKELGFQRKECSAVTGTRICFTPKRKISPDPPTPKSKERRYSLQESSPILRPMMTSSQISGIQRLRAGSMTGGEIKRKKHVVPRRRIKSTCGGLEVNKDQPLIKDLLKKHHKEK